MRLSEARAREILTLSIQLGIMANEFMVKAGLNNPKLTNEECVSIAKNYPFTYEYIRGVFLKEDKYSDPTN